MKNREIQWHVVAFLLGYPVLFLESAKRNVSSFALEKAERDETYRDCLMEWYKVCNQYLAAAK